MNREDRQCPPAVPCPEFNFSVSEKRSSHQGYTCCPVTCSIAVSQTFFPRIFLSIFLQFLLQCLFNPYQAFSGRTVVFVHLEMTGASTPHNPTMHIQSSFNNVDTSASNGKNAGRGDSASVRPKWLPESSFAGFRRDNTCPDSPEVASRADSPPRSWDLFHGAIRSVERVVGEAVSKGRPSDANPTTRRVQTSLLRRRQTNAQKSQMVSLSIHRSLERRVQEDDISAVNNRPTEQDVISAMRPCTAPEPLMSQRPSARRERQEALTEPKGDVPVIDICASAEGSLSARQLSSANGGRPDALLVTKPQKARVRRVSSLPRLDTSSQESHDDSVTGSGPGTAETTDSISTSLLGEKEKALNDMRARKLVQMFGSKPPPELYRTVTRRRVEEADLLSPSTDDLLASTLQESPRDSSSGLPKIALLPSKIAPLPPTPTTSELESSQHTEDYPSTLPPPALTVSVTTSVRVTASRNTTPVSATEDHDSQRLLAQASKLTNFFGVTYNDLKPFITSPPEHPNDKLTGDVKTAFWVRRHHDNQQRASKADMKEVIHALRLLKTSA